MLLCRFVLVAIVYHIWIQRCERVHNGNVKSEEEILQCLNGNILSLYNCKIYSGNRSLNSFHFSQSSLNTHLNEIHIVAWNRDVPNPALVRMKQKLSIS